MLILTSLVLNLVYTILSGTLFNENKIYANMHYVKSVKIRVSSRYEFFLVRIWALFTLWYLTRMLDKNAFGWSLINTKCKNKILRKKYEYCCFFLHKPWTSIKHTSLSKQGFTHKNTCCKWSIHFFLHSLI